MELTEEIPLQKHSQQLPSVLRFSSTLTDYTSHQTIYNKFRRQQTNLNTDIIQPTHRPSHQRPKSPYKNSMEHQSWASYTQDIQRKKRWDSSWDAIYGVWKGQDFRLCPVDRPEAEGTKSENQLRVEEFERRVHRDIERLIEARDEAERKDSGYFSEGDDSEREVADSDYDADVSGYEDEDEDDESSDEEEERHDKEEESSDEEEERHDKEEERHDEGRDDDDYDPDEKYINEEFIDEDGPLHVVVCLYSSSEDNYEYDI